jgi:hypothetical protein
VTFKEQAAADLSTFLNVAEFGETIIIDGDAVACILDDQDDPGPGADGVTLYDAQLYVRAADFYKQPVIRQRLTVGDRQADVVGVNEDQGMLTLRLRWYDS